MKELSPGERLGEKGRYTLEGLLGQGGMGAVYRAQDAKFGEPVALKVAAAVGQAAEMIQRRFQREAKIGYRLGRHSGFVRAFDWGRHGSLLLYLAMDLVRDARPLALDQGTRPERLARLAEAARLVELAHREGVVHRDLKPENLLVDAAGAVHLSDFGLAKLRGFEDLEVTALTEADLTGSHTALGTPRYMPPEQFDDAKHVDERCDVYALGVMLFSALTGRYPYEGRPLELARAQQEVLAGRAAAPRARDHDPEVPAELDELCAQAMALRPSERLPTVARLLEGLAPHLPRRRGGTAPRRAGRAPERPQPLDLPPYVVRAPGGEFRNERDGSALVWIPPGEQRLGSDAEGANQDERPRFRARITRGFFCHKHPVTWAAYRAFCEDVGWAPPAPALQLADGALWTAGDDHPVFHVTWQEAFHYAQWAGMRLPTEAEWEYAARGGEERAYPWGDDPPAASRGMWEGHPEGGHPAPVGSYPLGASPWGCLDLAGNVWEWVYDWYGRYSRWVKEDPLGPPEGELKVIRGGSWSTPSQHCRATTRRMFSPLMRAPNIGFRLVL
ncbi:MAG: bifunctional serine/threonine-protein kinase/formylglycine-generating enzyme family protein [Planctomycetota bacterium]